MKTTLQTQLPDRGYPPFLAAVSRFTRTLGVVVFFMMSGCADVGDACLFDSDCSGGSLCVRDMCRAACSVEQDCTAPENRCLLVTKERSAEKETVKVCVDDSFDSDLNGGQDNCEATGDCCSGHAECVELFDDPRAMCAPDARCLIPLS